MQARRGEQDALWGLRLCRRYNYAGREVCGGNVVPDFRHDCGARVPQPVQQIDDALRRHVRHRSCIPPCLKRLTSCSNLAFQGGASAAVLSCFAGAEALSSTSMTPSGAMLAMAAASHTLSHCSGLAILTCCDCPGRAQHGH